MYEECNQFSNNEDMSDLTSNTIATVHATIVAGTTSLSLSSVSMLDEAPTTIDDHYSSVLGDSFHFMDRTKVPSTMIERRGILLHSGKHG